MELGKGQGYNCTEKDIPCTLLSMQYSSGIATAIENFTQPRPLVLREPSSLVQLSVTDTTAESDMA